MLGLLLERVAERACGDTWRNIRDDLRRLGRSNETWFLSFIWRASRFMTTRALARQLGAGLEDDFGLRG